MKAAGNQQISYKVRKQMQTLQKKVLFIHLLWLSEINLENKKTI